MEFNTAKKPEEFRYVLKCKVLVKEVTYEDEQSKGTSLVTEKLVFLIPQESTERTKFYNTWLPDTDSEPTELGFEMGHPFYSMFRGALWRRSQFVGEIHIFVMSKAAEEELKRLEDKEVVIESLGINEDALLDQARDWELPYNKNLSVKNNESYGLTN